MPFSSSLSLKYSQERRRDSNDGLPLSWWYLGNELEWEDIPVYSNAINESVGGKLLFELCALCFLFAL